MAQGTSAHAKTKAQKDQVIPRVTQQMKEGWEHVLWTKSH